MRTLTPNGGATSTRRGGPTTTTTGGETRPHPSVLSRKCLGVLLRPPPGRVLSPPPAPGLLPGAHILDPFRVHFASAYLAESVIDLRDESGGPGVIYKVHSHATVPASHPALRWALVHRLRCAGSKWAGGHHARLSGRNPPERKP